MEIRNRIKALEYIHTRDLVAHPGNWREHPKAQADALLGVLKEVGIAGALLAYRSERQGGALVVIDGHLRKDAAPQTWPVLVLDVDDVEADYLLATHDPLAAMATADAGALDALLSSVQSGDAAVTTMLASLAESAGIYPPKDDADAEPQIDRAEELREQWGVELGQMWRLPSRTEGQEHRLICGDSTNADVVQRLLQGEVPLLMVTDPPYGVEYDANWRNEAAAEGKLAYAARRIGKVDNDDRADWSEAWRLFPGDVAYTWSPGGDHVIITGQALQAAGFEIRTMVVWRKPHFPISRGHYTYQHEPCWYAVKKGSTAHWIGPHNASTVWELSLDHNADGGHPTQKPLECMSRPIRNHDSALVYEPFCGSGTTIIAAENLSRQCRAVEINPAYVSVALERYWQAFQIRAELID